MVTDPRFNRRRALSLAWGIGASILLSACDRTDSEASVPALPNPALPESAPAVTTKPVVETAVSPAQTPSRPYDGVEIEFYFHIHSFAQDAVLAEIAKFRAITGIRINPIYEIGCYWPRSTPCPLPPDIWYGRGMWVPVYAADYLLLELDDFVATWDEWDDFYPITREDVTYEGHVYGIPFRTNYRGSVVIRPSFFEAAGLPPEPPATWEELNEIAPKLTVRDGERFEQAGINLQHHTQVYEDWLIQAGGSVFNADLTQPRNNTPAGHAALAQHVRHGLVDESMPIEGMVSGVPNLHAFCAGHVAIQQLWPGNIGSCEFNGPEVFADREVGPPLQGPSQRAMQLYVDKYMVFDDTEYPDAVFETLKYFASPGPNYEINIIYNGVMPCRGAMESYDLYEAEPWRAFAGNLEHTRLRQITPEHFGIQPAMSRWVEKAALGELSVDEALRGMDADVLDIMSNS